MSKAAGGRGSPPGAGKGHMEMRPDHGLWKEGQGAPRGVAGVGAPEGDCTGVWWLPRPPRPPPRRRRPPRPPPPPPGPGGGEPRSDDGGGARERAGGVAARAVEEDEDPGVEVDPGWTP